MDGAQNSNSQSSRFLINASFFKYDEEVYEWDNINHECIHQVQQIECFILVLWCPMLQKVYFQQRPRFLKANSLKQIRCV